MSTLNIFELDTATYNKVVAVSESKEIYSSDLYSKPESTRCSYTEVKETDRKIVLALAYLLTISGRKVHILVGNDAEVDDFSKLVMENKHKYIKKDDQSTVFQMGVGLMIGRTGCVRDNGFDTVIVVDSSYIGAFGYLASMSAFDQGKKVIVMN